VKKAPPPAAALPSREGLKRRLVQRFYTRFHMSLILASSGLVAMLASAALLQVGVTAMLVRYPIAVAAAYATFLGGVWLWLRYAGVAPQEQGSIGRSLAKNAEVPDIPLGGGSGGSGGPGGGAFSGKGGSFDGGGASGSWAAGARTPAMGANLQSQSLAAGASDVSAGGGSGSSLPDLGDLGDLGGDDLGLVILAIALIAAIVLSSGYLVWMAPDILTEAAFGAMLAGGLARRSRREDAGGWVSGVVRKTWWSFAIVLVLAVAFAGYSARHHPTAHTFRQALEMALSS
jgi:hypothetical protein